MKDSGLISATGMEDLSRRTPSMVHGQVEAANQLLW